MRQFASGVAQGVLVAIDADPLAIAERCADDRRKTLAIAWLKQIGEKHGLTAAGWRALAQQTSPAVRTNLRRLGSKRTAALVLHGYAVMMALGVAELGWQPPRTVRVFPKI